MIKRVYDVWAITLATILIIFAACPPALAAPQAMPFAPGEVLKYKLRWENVPAGKIEFQVLPFETVNGTTAYHFAMITRSIGLAKVFFKVKERIDAYTDTQMTHSIFYKKRRTGGKRPRDIKIEFDWQERQAEYSNFGEPNYPIDLMPGSLDPLSTLYFMRIAIDREGSRMERPVTNGRRNFMGRADVLRRETITLSNGKQYDTFCVAPDMGLFGGIFKKSKNAKIYLWITADDKRIPVLIKSKVKVGYFIGELVSAVY